jgi:phage terminase small subunit
MPGRKPTQLKQIAGTLRKDRQKNEPRPEAVMPTPPSWLSGEALEEWQRVAAELEPLGYLSRLDRGVMVLYAVLWARIALAGQGQGEPLKAAEIAQFRAAASSLGLDPVSRGRIDVTPKEKTKNPFTEVGA